ncbi:MAG: hypothetical protein F6K26_37020 [Moorea sp. SIO2I5]|nr:hypothetical protein [Moorena sp. SIO2I5]
MQSRYANAPLAARSRHHPLRLPATTCQGLVLALVLVPFDSNEFLATLRIRTLAYHT